MPKDKYKPSPGSGLRGSKVGSKSFNEVMDAAREVGYLGTVQKAQGIARATSLYKAKKEHGEKAAWDASTKLNILTQKLKKQYAKKKKETK